MYCKNCGNLLKDNEMFCINCGTKTENQNGQNPVISNFNVFDNQANQQVLNIDEELKKTYIGKNIEKILNGHGGSIWLFLFGPVYLLYRKLYLYGFLYYVIFLLLNLLNLSVFAFLIQIILCFFFYKIYLNYVDKKILSIKKNNPNKSFEELKEKCRKQGGVSYGMVALSIVILFIFGFINYTISSKKLVCESAEGNITIMYTDNIITGYVAYGISYDLDGQKKYAEKIGIDAYIEEFSNWFSANTTGSCK